MTIYRKYKSKADKERALSRVPAREVPAVKTFRSGREVCSKTADGKAEYRKRTLDMYERQDGLCGCCNIRMSEEEATFDHENGRGHGGANRDDRIILPCGKLQNRAVHGPCNTEKASRRGYQ